MGLFAVLRFCSRVGARLLVTLILGFGLGIIGPRRRRSECEQAARREGDGPYCRS